MRVSRLLPVLVAALAFWACGDDNGPTGGHSTTVSVKDNFFTPSPDTIPAGQITFSWSGSGTHNVSWDTGPSTPAGSGSMSSGIHQVTLVQGTYTYHCTFHGTASTGMRGMIVVQ